MDKIDDKKIHEFLSKLPNLDIDTSNSEEGRHRVKNLSQATSDWLFNMIYNMGNEKDRSFTSQFDHIFPEIKSIMEEAIEAGFVGEALPEEKGKHRLLIRWEEWRELVGREAEEDWVARTPNAYNSSAGGLEPYEI